MLFHRHGGDLTSVLVEISFQTMYFRLFVCVPGMYSETLDQVLGNSVYKSCILDYNSGHIVLQTSSERPLIISQLIPLSL